MVGSKWYRAVTVCLLVVYYSKYISGILCLGFRVICNQAYLFSEPFRIQSSQWIDCTKHIKFCILWSLRTLPHKGFFTVRVFRLLIMCIGLSNILSSKGSKPDVCEDKIISCLYPLYTSFQKIKLYSPGKPTFPRKTIPLKMKIIFQTCMPLKPKTVTTTVSWIC